MGDRRFAQALDRGIKTELKLSLVLFNFAEILQSDQVKRTPQ